MPSWRGNSCWDPGAGTAQGQSLRWVMSHIGHLTGSVIQNIFQLGTGYSLSSSSHLMLFEEFSDCSYNLYNCSSTGTIFIFICTPVVFFIKHYVTLPIIAENVIQSHLPSQVKAEMFQLVILSMIQYFCTWKTKSIKFSSLKSMLKAPAAPGSKRLCPTANPPDHV